MDYSFTSILPALIVLVLGIMTKRVLFSLLCGIISACAIASTWHPLATVKLFLLRLWQTSELSYLSSWQTLKHSNTVLIFFFLSCLGIIISLLEYSGGATAYARAIQKRLKTPRQVESTSVLLSLSLFIDDYFSALTVGTIMYPITDRFRIPRVKLSFLVAALAAPIAVLSPLSSWVAVMIGQLEMAGIGNTAETAQTILADPFYVYIKTIPFISYSLTLFGAVLFIIARRISFGPMQEQELVALSHNNMFGGKQPILRTSAASNAHALNPHLLDFFVPLGSFLIAVCSFLLYTGSYHHFGGTNSFMNALQSANSPLSLAGGSAVALLISSAFLLMRKKVTFELFPRLSLEGALLMLPAQLILLLSWTLGTLLRIDLNTGAYLAHQLVSAVPIALLPLMFFIAATLTSFAMGSSWGTIAIIIPIAVPLLLNLVGIPTPVELSAIPQLFPLLGAILSGAVIGNHFCPISDTNIMASTSTAAYHLDHVKSQYLYLVPVFLASCIAFLIAGITAPYGLALSSLISTAVSICIALILLSIFDRLYHVPHSKGSNGKA